MCDVIWWRHNYTKSISLYIINTLLIINACTWCIICPSDGKTLSSKHILYYTYLIFSLDIIISNGRKKPTQIHESTFWYIDHTHKHWPPCLINRMYRKWHSDRTKVRIYWNWKPKQNTQLISAEMHLLWLVVTLKYWNCPTSKSVFTSSDSDPQLTLTSDDVAIDLDRLE